MFCGFAGDGFTKKEKAEAKPRRVGYNPRKCGSVKPTKQPRMVEFASLPVLYQKNRFFVNK